MTQDSYECLVSIDFCGGVLKVLRKNISQQFYGPSEDSGEPQIEVVLQQDNALEKIQTIDRLREFTRKNRCDTSACILENYQAFAYIASLLLNKGRLITSSELYGFLEADFDLIVSQNLPRVEDVSLCFSVVKAKNIGVFEVLKVQLSLDNLEVELAEVPHRRNIAK